MDPFRMFMLHRISVYHFPLIFSLGHVLSSIEVFFSLMLW